MKVIKFLLLSICFQAINIFAENSLIGEIIDQIGWESQEVRDFKTFFNDLKIKVSDIKKQLKFLNKNDEIFISAEAEAERALNLIEKIANQIGWDSEKINKLKSEVGNLLKFLKMQTELKSSSQEVCSEPIETEGGQLNKKKRKRGGRRARARKVAEQKKSELKSSSQEVCSKPNFFS